MYVFLSNIFYRFSLTPIFKKLDAFIPALSLLGTFRNLRCFSFMFHKRQRKFLNKIPTPVCFFLLYIYIVNICFLSNRFYVFYWRQFSKSWTPSFLPYPCSVGWSLRLFFVYFPQKKPQRSTWDTNPCVFLFIIYIYSKCMFFEWDIFMSFHWRQFSKSWTPSFLPYPCSVHRLNLLFCWLLHNQHKADLNDITNPCVFLFIILYY